MCTLLCGEVTAAVEEGFLGWNSQGLLIQGWDVDVDEDGLERPFTLVSGRGTNKAT